MECVIHFGYFATYIFRNCNKYLDIVNDGQVEKKNAIKKKTMKYILFQIVNECFDLEMHNFIFVNVELIITT